MSESNLQEILEEYTAVTPAGNDLTILRSFINRYPQFEREIQDFAVARAVIRHTPDVDFSQDDEQRVRESGLAALRSIRRTFTASPAPMVFSASASERPVERAAKDIVSLVDTAAANGLTRQTFAAAVGLSSSLIVALDKRRIEFASIPGAMIARLAATLETTEEAIVAYFNPRQPLLKRLSVSFKARTRAKQLGPKDFADAVREDQQLSADEKRKLLELK